LVTEISFSVPKIDFIASRTGKLARETVATREYWLSPPAEAAIGNEENQEIEEKSARLRLEISVGARLRQVGGTDLSQSTGQSELTASKGDWQQILSTLGQLYVRDCLVNWEAFDSPYQRQRCSLPTYPFQRQYYWLETPEVGDRS
jgi:acyl transferase domain-containing protein